MAPLWKSLNIKEDCAANAFSLGSNMLRYATPDDADAIAEIHVDTWRAICDGIVPASMLASLSKSAKAAGWERDISVDPHQVLLVDDDGSTVGWVAIGSSRDANGSEKGEVYAIYVRPEKWGKGFGQLLMSRAEEELWDRGFRQITLWVLERNEAARRFYEKGGYVPDGGKKDIALGDATLVELRYGKQKPA